MYILYAHETSGMADYNAGDDGEGLCLQGGRKVGKVHSVHSQNKYRWTDRNKLTTACSWGMEHTSVQQDWSACDTQGQQRPVRRDLPMLLCLSYHSYAVRRQSLSFFAPRRTDGHLFRRLCTRVCRKEKTHTDIGSPVFHTLGSRRLGRGEILATQNARVCTD